ncbi:hypothetical protein WMY93_031100 [Mugilogobius chulae]|uniref:Uncharacterized protein n=1 Tax=Mugilogobius chulae TaxID=88201 RepID=A0AAW0MIV0_9GOBI
MSVVTLDPSRYALRPLDAVARLVKAPSFLADPNGAFAKYTVDKVVRPSAVNSSISAEATVLISQAHMGVNLFTQQRHTCLMLAGYVYKMLVPDEVVPVGTKFCKRYRITDQREAQQGAYDTVVNGVQTREYSQVFQLSSKVVTMRFGCLLGVTVPSVAADLIKREFDAASTSWDLTKTIEVLRYCAAQPTLTDRIAHKTKTCSRAEKLDCILVVAELTCGMINLQPESFLCALENARRILGSERPEVAIMGDSLFRVVSQRGAGATAPLIVSEDARILPEFSVYTMAEENGRVAGGGYEFAMRELTRGTLGNRDLPFTDETSFRAAPIEAKVDYVRLGGGNADRIPVVHVDGVQMEHGRDRDTSTEHKAFCNSEGFKWEYFTVGCLPPALSQISPCHVLSANETEEVGYRHLAARSPRVSYLHQYDGKVVCVSLRSLHQRGNPKEFFCRERRARLQTEVNALMRGDLNAIPVDRLPLLARTRAWYQKVQNPASLLEFDAREMVVPRPSQGSRDAAVDRWVVRPRVALFNASSMNDIDGEMAQIGSELLAHFDGGEHAKRLVPILAFLEQALQYVNGLESALAFRSDILSTGASITSGAAVLKEGWTKGRKFWSWFADPICAVYVKRFLATKEDAGDISAEERTVLLKLECIYNSLLEVFKAVVGHRRNSVVACMPAFFSPGRGDSVDPKSGYPLAFTLDDMDYCNLMYWVVLPAMGAKVYRARSGTPGSSGAGKIFTVSYREDERDLNAELNLTQENALTVTRLSDGCVFSKLAPAADQWEDATQDFEPTASKHKGCQDVGFSDTSLVTYLWAIRLHKLSELSNNLAKVLLGVHYSTLITHQVINDHYDTRYYSGLSYLLFRGVRFTGCGVSLMQQKSALYTLGAEIVCVPTAHSTHQVHTVNQYCESVVIPETLDSPGVYMPNLYMKDVRGGDVHVNSGSPFDLVVADGYSGFCPESDTASGYRRPYIFTAGRSERLNGSVARDVLMRAEAYTCMPSLLRPFSSAIWPRGRNGKQRGCGGEESNHKLFSEALHVVEFEKGVLDPIGDPFKDTVERVNGNKRPTDVMQHMLGVAFCGTYGIGFTSDKKLMSESDAGRETLAERLAPRISVLTCLCVRARVSECLPACLRGCVCVCVCVRAPAFLTDSRMGIMELSSVSRKVVRGLCRLTVFVMSCGVCFFTFLFTPSGAHESRLNLMRKKDEVNLDMAINTVSRSIARLDENVTLLTQSVRTSEPGKNAHHAWFVNELKSSQMQRDGLRYLLGALRGRVDTQRLVGAVKTLCENVGLQLSASAYINKQVLSLAVQRHLEEEREPVTKPTVENAYRQQYANFATNVETVYHNVEPEKQ